MQKRKKDKTRNTGKVLIDLVREPQIKRAFKLFISI
jgi:hypothetical protein